MSVYALVSAEGEIRAAAQAGMLVPFVGAGMSRPLCRGWIEFLDALNMALGINSVFVSSAAAQNDPNALYRIADRAAFALRLLADDRRGMVVRAALIPDDVGRLAYPDRPVPPQTAALAASSWPLIITTNYDDLLIASQTESMVVGRAPEHCEAVIRSLDVDRRPMLWCVQGFVGGIRHDPQILSRDQSLLVDEIVIGHQQYQYAASQSPAFRRAFSEVFRRRSLMFLGSGLSESYFINLFSEIILNYGPSPRPHFAFFSQEEIDRGMADAEFLQVRLGITPIVYGSTYAELPQAIARLFPGRDDAGRPADDPIRVFMPSATEFSVNRAASGGDLDLCIRLRELTAPGSDECVVISAGRGGSGPAFGSQGRSFFRLLGDGSLGRSGHWLPTAYPDLYRLDDPRHAVFALIARDTSMTTIDRRDLLQVGCATTAALQAIEGLAQFDMVIMGLIAAGDSTFASPTFPFLAQLAGLRKFAAQPPVSARPLRRVDIRIIDPAVTGPLTGGRLPVREMLSSDLVRVFVRVVDAHARAESFAVSVPHHWRVRDVLTFYQISEENIVVDVRPLANRAILDALDAPVLPMLAIDVAPRPV